MVDGSLVSPSLPELVPWNELAPGSHPQCLAPVLGLGASLDL